jgi:hypothetical protein
MGRRNALEALMARGPLPNPNALRRNKPTIPTTKLSASGRADPAPAVPPWCELGADGLAWWTWAWSSPEANGWSDSLIDVVARRASLVDDLAALARVGSLDAWELLACEEMAEVRALVGRLAGLATGRLQVLKACHDIDAQLGFGAKNLAALRWEIVADAGTMSSVGPGADEVARQREERRRRIEAS